jgi:hypothetical protein
MLPDVGCNQGHFAFYGSRIDFLGGIASEKKAQDGSLTSIAVMGTADAQTACWQWETMQLYNLLKGITLSFGYLICNKLERSSFEPHEGAMYNLALLSILSNYIFSNYIRVFP